MNISHTQTNTKNNDKTKENTKINENNLKSIKKQLYIQIYKYKHRRKIMQRYQLQDLVLVLKDVVFDNQKSSKLNGKALYTLIKNYKILQPQVQTYDSMFKIQQVQGFKEFDQKRDQIINKYKEENYQQLSNQLSQQQTIKHNSNINNLILQLRVQESMQEFFNKFDELTNKKLDFLNEDVDMQQLGIKKIEVDDIQSLKLNGNQMMILMELIKSE